MFVRHLRTCAALTLLAIAAAPSLAQEFVNLTPITIPNVGVAAPYPSTITVSGVSGNINNFAVTLGGLTHTFPADLRVLLVSPNGQKFLLMSESGGSENVQGAFLRFSSEATANLSTPLVDGAYLPSGSSLGTSLPAPAPAAPYSLILNTLNGSNPNGVWSLYVTDTASGDQGSLASWSVTINGQSIPTPQTTAFSYQGVLKDGNAAIQGSPRVRFTLFDHPTRTQPANILGQTIRDFSGIQDGLINTSLDFGSIMLRSQQKWLGIEVASVAGGPYTTLTPRQPLNAAPVASATSAPWVRANPLADSIFSPNLVGINTSQPRSWLHVRNSGNGNAALTLEGFSDGGDCYMSFFPNGFGNIRGGYFGFPDGGQSWLRLVNEAPSGDIELVTNGSGSVSVGPILGGAAAGFRMEVAGSIRCTSLTQTSSARYKDEIADLPQGLAQLVQLRPVSYIWNNLTDETTRGKHDLGFIAEDVASVLPDAVTCDTQGNALGIDYSRITVLAVQAIKEMNAKHEAQLQALREQNEALLTRLERIENARP
jgi:subtilisin-like proprotein convertase family protein